MNAIHLTIDGQSVGVPAGATVLDAARKAGITVPTVCDHKDLSPYGACRMCIVEIEGVRGYPTSCTTPAAEGMQVRTQSPELESLRKRTLELMLSGHPNSCLVCAHREACESFRPKATKAGRSTRCGFCSNREECDLRTMALEAGDRDLHLPTLYAAHNLEREDPFMDRDYNLCVLCARCWRICEKIHGKPAISIINRGKEARVGTAFHKSHVHSGCTFCGSCIDICPTGTLTDRFARWYGKPDTRADSTCQLCPEGCAMVAQARSGQLVATAMTAFQPEASLCALGRFGYAQLVNAPTRLLRPTIRENGEAFTVDWATALDTAASGLRPHAGKIGMIVSAAISREERHLYEQLARELGARMAIVPTVPAGRESPVPEWIAEVGSDTITAMILGGNFLDQEQLRGLDFLVVLDGLPARFQDMANVLLPVALLSESAGTFRNAAGEIKPLARVSRAPGQARPEWEIVRDLGRRLGFASMEFSSLADIGAAVGDDPSPAAYPGAPRHDVFSLPAFYRGHRTADIVSALEAFGLPKSAGTVSGDAPEDAPVEGFELLEKRELVPNMHLLRIRAPQIAAHAKPGQFVILMAGETSERTPFTLADWNADRGDITLVIEEVGRSSRELVSLRVGARLAHVSGPLGQPFDIQKKGNVVLGGGCYGIGGILPLARALKAAGNRVTSVIEASSSYLLFWEEELRAVSDDVRIATKDGSRGTRGGVQEVFKQLHHHEGPVDMFIAMGCTFMMRMTSELTRPWNVPTFVALNPIMVDGTGMCGACRVSIHEETRFACIDGPFFDAHGVDWDELDCRRSAYAREEVEALPQTVDLNALMFPESARQGCGCGR